MALLTAQPTSNLIDHLVAALPTPARQGRPERFLTSGSIGREDLFTSTVTASPGTSIWVQTPVPFWALEQAAETGNEAAFVLAWSGLNTIGLDPQAYQRVTRLALQAGARVLARTISAQGAERYPDDPALRKMAHVLAPPAILSETVPAQPDVQRNQEWIQANRDEYRNHWVALRAGKLVASAQSLDALLERVPDPTGVLLTAVF